MTDEVTSIGDKAFFGFNGLTSVTIPNSVTSIGEKAFYDCYNITSINIPNSVTSIGPNAFRGCHGLTSVAIPNSVISIDSCAFRNCSNLKQVFALPENPPSLFDNSFSNYDITLRVKEASIDKYKSTSPWNKFAKIMTIVEGDVNGDDKVNEEDIEEVVNYIMGNPSDKFNKALADMNEDGDVNAADIVKIVNIINLQK